MDRHITEEEWIAEGKKLFGDDKMAWKVKCPSCGHVQSVKDYKDAGASSGMIAFSCIGRVLNTDKTIGDKTGGPCNYAGGGLFRLNPVHVKSDDGEVHEMFEFAREGI